MFIQFNVFYLIFIFYFDNHHLKILNKFFSISFLWKKIEVLRTFGQTFFRKLKSTKSMKIFKKPRWKIEKKIQKIKFDLRKWRKNNNLLYFKIILSMIRGVGWFLVMAACDGDAFASFER